MGYDRYEFLISDVRAIRDEEQTAFVVATVASPRPLKTRDSIPKGGISTKLTK